MIHFANLIPNLPNKKKQAKQGAIGAILASESATCWGEAVDVLAQKLSLRLLTQRGRNLGKLFLHPKIFRILKISENAYSIFRSNIPTTTTSTLLPAKNIHQPTAAKPQKSLEVPNWRHWPWVIPSRVNSAKFGP